MQFSGLLFFLSILEAGAFALGAGMQDLFIKKKLTFFKVKIAMLLVFS